MIGERPHRYDEGTIFEKGWFMGLLIAIVVLLGVALWYVVSHPDQVAKWVSPEREPAKVRPLKPTIQ